MSIPINISIIRTLLFVIIPLLIFQGQAFAEITTLVALGETWTYKDDGSDQQGAWRTYPFDDSGWSSGAAQLGYGDGDEATTVGYGGNSNSKYITTYFRKTFSVSDPSLYKCLKLRLLRDDGAIVYINDHEVGRSNMPDGMITYQTPASEVVGGDDESRVFVTFLDPVVLSAGGSNIIAVEIHQISQTSSDISFDLELTASTSACFTKGPYLIYPGDNTKMDVLWQLTDTDRAKIEWGLDTGFSTGAADTSEYGSAHQHAHTISALIPGTKYYYRVSANATDQDHQHTGSFTAAPPADAEDVKLLVHGDTQTLPADHDTVAAGMISAFTSDSSYQTMVLAAGDLVSAGRDESSWATEFFDPTYTHIQELLANLAFQSCMGNHETFGTGENLFQTYFPYPSVFDNYWSFDYGPVHVAVVDQYAQGTYPNNMIGSAQLSWLDADLASTDRPWKFIIFHEPGWSAGGGHDNNTQVQTDIQPLCEQYDVSLVFAGHNHFYARAMVNGVHHITTVGGAPLRTPVAGYPHVLVAKSVTHYCKVEISKDTLTFQAVQPDGAIVDSFIINPIRPVPITQPIRPAMFLLVN
ncbi:MAG: metallophosphoesterase family protein [Thermodesulfobacteriota bacterium]|nr:metallophosphoesterase family protein [Thermodesulfobacteriota bacterium]